MRRLMASVLLVRTPDHHVYLRTLIDIKQYIKLKLA